MDFDNFIRRFTQYVGQLQRQCGLRIPCKLFVVLRGRSSRAPQSIDLSFGKQDSNNDEENTGSAVSPNENNNGFDYSFGYNVNLQGSVEVSFSQAQIDFS